MSASRASPSPTFPRSVAAMKKPRSLLVYNREESYRWRRTRARARAGLVTLTFKDAEYDRDVQSMVKHGLSLWRGPRPAPR